MIPGRLWRLDEGDRGAAGNLRHVPHDLAAERGHLLRVRSRIVDLDVDRKGYPLAALDHDEDLLTGASRSAWATPADAPTSGSS